MLLIADSGSTKTDWVLTDGKNRSHYKTIGYNPLFINSESIYISISQKLTSAFDGTDVKEVYFYGADCSAPENAAIVHKALFRCFINAKIYMGYDMLAAARALLGNKRGFAAILGTGSNSSIYDGKVIEKNIEPLGYLLGDEGSGSYIGKQIIRDHMRSWLPPELEEDFDLTYHLSDAQVFDSMYNKSFPNRFLSGFCEFADKHKMHSYIKRIVRESFNDFFKNLVTRYPEYQNLSFNCVGSVGFIFKNILTEVADSYNMKTGRIIKSPIEDLVNYHLGIER